MNLQTLENQKSNILAHKEPLTTNISTSNSYRKSNHRNNCTICQTDKKNKNTVLHDLVLALEFKELIQKHKITPNTIWKHIDTLSLFENIRWLRHAYLTKTLIKADVKDAKVSEMLMLLDQLNKMDGAYQSTDSPKNVQIFQQFNQLINDQALKNNILLPSDTNVKPLINKDKGKTERASEK